MKTIQDRREDKLRTKLESIREQAIRAYTSPEELPYLIFTCLTGRQSLLNADELKAELAEMMKELA